MQKYSDILKNLTEHELFDLAEQVSDIAGNMYLSYISVEIKNQVKKIKTKQEKELELNIKKDNIISIKKEKKNNLVDIKKDIAAIKDSIQNTADVVNLFTDIEKNRTNTDEEIKKVNNRLDKLENSINQLINMLQKS